MATSRKETSHGKEICRYETVTLIINDGGEIASAACTCTLWNGHSRHRGPDCSHITEARSGHTSVGVKSGTAAEWRDGLRAAIQNTSTPAPPKSSPSLSKATGPVFLFGPTGDGKKHRHQTGHPQVRADFAQGVGASATHPLLCWARLRPGAFPPRPYRRCLVNKPARARPFSSWTNSSVSPVGQHPADQLHGGGGHALAERGGLYKNYPELAGQDILVIPAPRGRWTFAQPPT